MGADGGFATDEDTLSKAMRRKASANLDYSGINNCSKSFLSFSTPAISAKLGKVGVSLGSSDKDILVSSKALRHMEFDRLKCTPKVSSKADISTTEDDDEAYANTDGQLLSHLVGDVSEVGSDEEMLGSIYDLKASFQKSKSSAAKKSSRPGKKAKLSKSISSSK
jgi:hypothetical protein